MSRGSRGNAARAEASAIARTRSRPDAAALPMATASPLKIRKSRLIPVAPYIFPFAADASILETLIVSPVFSPVSFTVCPACSSSPAKSWFAML